MSEITQVEFLWTASDELMRREAIEGGRTEKAARVLSLDLAGLSVEERQVVVPAARLVSNPERWQVDLRRYCQMNEKMPSYDQGSPSRYYTAQASIVLAEPLTKETAVALTAHYHALSAETVAKAEALAQAYRDEAAERKAVEDAEAIAEFDRFIAIFDELRPQVEALVASDDLAAMEAWQWPDGYEAIFPMANKWSYGPDRYFSQAREARGIKASLGSLLESRIKNLRQERDMAEKDAWIKAHGSNHLRRAWAAGHHSGRQYAIERAAQQYPAWTLDYNGTMGTEDRPFPSLRALDVCDEAAASGLEAEIVWLTAPASYSVRDDDEYEYEYDEFEAREAVIAFEPHLNKWLVREI